MKLHRIILITAAFGFCAFNLKGQSMNFHGSLSGYETGLTISPDIYKSYVSTFINLRHMQSTPIFQLKEESPAYRWLLHRLFQPKYLLLQASFYPLAFASSQLESFHQEIFERFTFHNINLLSAAGSGPDEPYALSFLLGNVALIGYREKTAGAGQKLRQTGAMLAGFMISGGHWHIHDNIRVDDFWQQFEVILTGRMKSGKVDPQQLEWNFRVGVKAHKNMLDHDVFTLSLYRSHTNWNAHWFSLLKNARFQYEAHFPIRQIGGMTSLTSRQLLSYSKKMPLKLWHRYIAIRLGGGVVWERERLFDRKELRFSSDYSSYFTWLIQPGVEF